VRKNKKEKFCLFLLILITTGISPVLAQNSGTGMNVLDLGLASDDEFTQALDKAGDIELINKEDNLTGEAVTTGETPAAQAVPAKQETAVGSGGGITNGNTGGITGDNEYLVESRRLARLAEDSFAEGDYDASAKYADEAAWLATQSDIWIQQSLEGLRTSGGRTPSSAPLPATYTVRPWSVSKDCFWNIAGFPWVYGNPHQWRLLYNANKSKLPNPNNPNVIEPGTVLDIPSIKGEVRQGAWESGRTYEPIR